ncbi:MAG: regulatory protein RecX [Lachnospiraceae bacterium]|nr:regulatory protein RecX [Lachnospiraceae bacterium]
MTDHSDIRNEVIKEAEKKALRLLTISDRTEYQLREKLREGDFPPEAIDAAISYVRSYHYIDDGRYAEVYVRSKKNEKSVYEIRMELRKRGVSEDLIENAILSGDLDDRKVIRHLFEKKYRAKDLTDPKIYERAFRYFGSRGFSYEDIRSAVTEALESEEI